MQTLTKKRNPETNKAECYNYEAFFESSPDLLIIFGFDGYFKKVNPSVSELLEYSNEELYSRPIVDFVFSEDRERTEEARIKASMNNPVINFENRCVSKNGEIAWLSWTIMPVHCDGLIFAIGKNITDKKRMENERNQLLTNLTRVNDNLKELTYTTSHDLRSPVNNLLFVFDLIDVTKIHDAETLDLIGILKMASENLRQMLNEYIDVFNHEDTLNMNIEELNLNECLNVVLESIPNLIKNSKAIITADFSQLETIRFNKAYLKSIFLNLITNSIKYARPNITPIISIKSQKVNGSSQLVISDNGLGFDMKKVKDKIFGLNQKFHKHDDSKGIGLYLVHNHINSLGGNIEVESKLNEGAKFTITFKD